LRQTARWFGLAILESADLSIDYARFASLSDHAQRLDDVDLSIVDCGVSFSSARQLLGLCRRLRNFPALQHSRRLRRRDRPDQKSCFTMGRALGHALRHNRQLTPGARRRFWFAGATSVVRLDLRGGRNVLRLA